MLEGRALTAGLHRTRDGAQIWGPSSYARSLGGSCGEGERLRGTAPRAGSSDQAQAGSPAPDTLTRVTCSRKGVGQGQCLPSVSQGLPGPRVGWRKTVTVHESLAGC